MLLFKFEMKVEISFPLTFQCFVWGWMMVGTVYTDVFLRVVWRSRSVTLRSPVEEII